MEVPRTHIYTHLYALLFGLHTQSQWQPGEDQISSFPRCSLSSLWSGIDVLFLLTSSRDCEKRERVSVSWKHRLKTECESELWLSTKLACTGATKSNETREVCETAQLYETRLCSPPGCVIHVMPQDLLTCLLPQTPGTPSTVTPSSIDFIGRFVFINAERY